MFAMREVLHRNAAIELDSGGMKLNVKVSYSKGFLVESCKARRCPAQDCHSEEKSAVGIVRTNGLPIETSQGDFVGVYENVSRFNHSCNNNVGAPDLKSALVE